MKTKSLFSLKDALLALWINIQLLNVDLFSHKKAQELLKLTVGQHPEQAKQLIKSKLEVWKALFVIVMQLT